MKKLSLLLGACLIIMTITGIQSCKTTAKTSASKMFKFNLEEGKGYDYEMIFDIDTKAGGQNISMTIAGLYSMNVTATEGNVKSVTTAYKSLRMNMKMMGMEIDIDSDKPVQDNGDGDVTKNPIGMMNKVIGGIVGKKFIIKYLLIWWTQWE